MNENETLAELLFGEIFKTPEDYFERYPKRDLKEGAAVTRFAPSPTGFLHIGGLFAAMVAKRVAEKSGGVFYLRIEDTDKKREIDGGVKLIVDGLNAFGITPDEGFVDGENETGNYGPYRQSDRAEIYRCFAKKLVAEGKAYPCFCGEDEIAEIRKEQEADKLRTGYYGKYAKCRNLTLDEIKAKLDAGMPYVVRLRSEGSEEHRIKFNDLIKGTIEMPQNDQDVVILKRDGIPTYHFAHAVDDTLMGTTTVVRGDEWISSVPLHIELFRALGFKVPKYAHIAPIMKVDGDGKRKLSKRKDPEAAVSYYHEIGYPAESVIEYLMTLANSDFEDWRRINKTAPVSDFKFNLKKMGVSGALFDLVKLSDVSKNVISTIPADELLDKILVWSKEFNKKLYELLSADKEYATEILRIDRENKKPRKDIAKWADVSDYVAYFYDELWDSNRRLPEHIDASDAVNILKKYVTVYDKNDSKDVWFGKIKSICPELGFASEVKEYKANPDAYKGHVGDVSTVIRVAVTGRQNTPDLYQILKLLDNRAIERMESFIKVLEK